ncbi:MAG TPA: hypothetical protein VN229_20280, partial [Terriglobales bacterium]|nr:hypothetical protein [Terriglobales bacterium]
MSAGAEGTTKDVTTHKKQAAGEQGRSPASGPNAATIADWTDQYFLKTKAVVQKFGDATVTYAVFMRRPVVSAPRIAVDWLQR